MDCSKVEARPDAWGGVGVYATQLIRKGELVERGVVQRLPVDGCPEDGVGFKDPILEIDFWCV